MAARLRDYIVGGVFVGLLALIAIIARGNRTDTNFADNRDRIERLEAHNDSTASMTRANSNRLAASIVDSLTARMDRKFESQRRSMTYDRDKIIDSVRTYAQRRH